MSLSKNSRMMRESKHEEVNRKKGQLLNRIEKELERANRQPSIRLGKKVKKISARTSFVTSEEVEVENIEQVKLIDEVNLNTKKTRIPLKKIKRKVSFREKPETINFEDDIE